MLIVIIFTVSGIVFLILRDTTNVIDTRFTETYNATGPSATGTPPSLDEERRQNCYENIFKVEDAGRLSIYTNLQFSLLVS